jgi:hypothetical protein
VVAVADRMSYDDGLLLLKGNVRVQKRRGREEETIQGQKVVIDRKTAKVSVEGAGGVRLAVPALGPVPVSVDFGFPTVKEGAGEKRPDARPADTDLPALRKEVEELREKVKKLEGRFPQAGAGAREFSIADFYRHPGSAAFYYELVVADTPARPTATSRSNASKRCGSRRGLEGLCLNQLPHVPGESQRAITSISFLRLSVPTRSTRSFTATMSARPMAGFAGSTNRAADA